MSQPAIPACAGLRAFADDVCARGRPDLRYVDFWREFPTDDNASIRTMFRALFSGLGLRKPLTIRSLFAHHGAGPERAESELRRERHVHVAFSGEAHHLDFGAHDLNLVMAPDDPSLNVVPFVGFGANAHEYGLWPRFTQRRAPAAAEKFCVAVVSNDRGPERQRFLTRLALRRSIDSCGRWLNTTGFFAPRDEQQFGDRYYPFLAQYRFMVCFENTRQPFYLTEKLANAYAAGCVPVYWGAPEAASWLNPRAFLQLEDESDAAMDRLIETMLTLDADRTAYAKIHREPLLIGAMPELMRLDVTREKIARVLRCSRPDAF